MLLCQNGSGYKKNHLLPFLHCFKGSTDCHLCFSIPHITANQTIHDFTAFHIFLGGCNGGKLIFRLLKGKHFLKFLLPDRVFSKLVPFLALTNSIQFHQIFGHRCDCSTDSRFGFHPFLRSQLVDFGFSGICRSIFLDRIQCCGDDI